MGIVFGRISVEVPPFDLILAEEVIRQAFIAAVENVPTETTTATIHPSPEDVKHAVEVIRSNKIQVRQYGPTISASFRTGSDDLSTEEGFHVLADYIFGKNASQKGSSSIPMTAPVVTQPNSSVPQSKTTIPMTAPVVTRTASSSATEVIMSFTLPASRFKDIDSVPKPLDDRIILQMEQPMSFIVLQFSGRTTASVVAAKSAALLTCLTTLLRKEPSLSASIAAARLWRYNPPFCVPFLRTNELAIPLTDAQRQCLEKFNVH